MTVQELIPALGLEIVSGDGPHLARPITGGYASDLLSCVMAGAKEGNVWVTLQAHPNVIAVADLLDLACVIITEGTRPDEETLSRAREKGIPVLLSEQGTFTVVSRLAALGIEGTR
ncbi:MAG: serine kinase [Chloroflexi bacterium]|nr:serine kinase [Chloroflexota bacterium]